MWGILSSAQGIEVPILKALAWHLRCIRWCILLLLLSDWGVALHKWVRMPPSPYMEGVDQYGRRCGLSSMRGVLNDR